MMGSQVQEAAIHWSEQWKQALIDARREADDKSRSIPRMELLISRLIRHFLRTTPSTLHEDMQNALAEIGQKFKCPAVILLACRDDHCIDPVKIAVDIQGREQAEQKVKNLQEISSHWLQYESAFLAQRGTAIKSSEAGLLFRALDCSSFLLVPVTPEKNMFGGLFLVFDDSSEIPKPYEQRLLDAFLELFYVVSERIVTFSELKEREEMLARTEALAGIGSWDEDYTTHRITFTEEAARIFELPPNVTELTREQYLEFIYPDDKPAVAERFKRSLISPGRYDGVYRVVTAKGNIRTIRAITETMIGEDQVLTGRSGMVQDITDQREKEQRLLLSSRVYESIIEGVVIADNKGMIEGVNPAFCRITGYCEEEVLGQPVSILDNRKADKLFLHSIIRSCLRNGFWQGEIWNQRKNGEVFPQHMTVTCIRDERKRICNFIGVFEDISQIRQSEEQLDFLANNDSLTGLPNRTSIQLEVDKSLQVAADKNSRVALLHVDLDHFKHINDSLGHPAGDRLLQICARRLRGRLRETDIVARLGGDEFLVVLNNIIDDAQITRVTNMLQQLLSQPYDIGLNQDLFVGVSIGVSVYPDHGTEVAQLLSNAEVAMYHAKNSGRNHSCFYSSDLTQAANDRLELGSQLRQALKKECELELWFQPQMDATNNRLVGAEALIRWNHPQEGLIFPDRFLPVAEDAGLISTLDYWVLESACCRLARWQSLGYAPIVLAVNITQPTFISGGLVERLKALLGYYRLDPQWLELEITEGALLKPTPGVMNTIAGIKELGISLAVDDFGTGYSSLAYLHRYRVDKLKIDRSFINTLEDTEEEGRIITRTILNLAEGLGLAVLAEGVETEGQLKFMQENGCDNFQGYYFSKPLSHNDFSRWIK
ncbi:MAG: GGDEF domain-containing protein [Oceanospirillaceae bacterium]|nr:GGDEF domain-containing protein [Oceanospirillaceae bacterium]MBT14298.1 GGDEF domain-containing protein [Oceanospirillaceae bacterium]|tara:strand:+ start:40325 stop:42976 length:2652 start_codon:yes stop_codon:yes gene_type:complete